MKKHDYWKIAKWALGTALVGTSLLFLCSSNTKKDTRYRLENRVQQTAPVEVNKIESKINNYIDNNSTNYIKDSNEITETNEPNKTSLETEVSIPKFYKISEKGIDLIKRFEGFQPEQYWDVKHWAIGYGHKNNENLTKISEEEASERLSKDLISIEKTVSEHVKVPLTQEQYDALVSFTYNFNEEKFRNSTLLKKLNNKDYEGAAEEFKRWVNIYNKKGNKIVLDGLVERRQAEYELFKLD